MTLMSIWLPAGIFLLSALLVRLLSAPAKKWDWVDQPSTRKHHTHPVPLVGGVAMWAAFVVGVLLLPEKPLDYPIMLGGMTLLVVVGHYDDLHHVHPRWRFVFQACAVLLMGLADHCRLANLGNLFGLGDIQTGWMGGLFTMIAVIGVINALNMIDGLDGLAGGLALIATGWMLTLCVSAPVMPTSRANTLLLLMMVIAGFLIHNLRHPWRDRASSFMGDAGSTFLGFVIAWFAIRMSQDPTDAMDPVTALWIIAIPLIDTVTVMVRRIKTGESPFAADRQHLHHILLGLGLSDGKAVAIVLMAGVLLGGLGVATQWLGVAEWQRFLTFIGLFVGYYLVTTRIQKRKHMRPLQSGDRRISQGSHQ